MVSGHKTIVHGVAARRYVSQLRDLVKVELGNLLTEQGSGIRAK